MVRFIVFLSCVAILIGCSTPNQIANSATVPPKTEAFPTPTTEVVVSDIPKEAWEPIFFESINQRTKSAGIGRLRDIGLKDDDIEVRIWFGFGLTTLEGFVISRKDSEWKALHLYEDYEKSEFHDRMDELNKPQNGWDANWNLLLEHRLLILPDARAIGCEVTANDGFSYVIEVKKGIKYRTYMYDNPEPDQCGEAREILAISNIISDGFNLPQFRTKLD